MSFFLIFQVDLGVAVQRACENIAQPLKFLYPLDISIKEKIEAIAKSYGASGVEYSEEVTSALILSEFCLCPFYIYVAICQQIICE